ncbi:MAG: IS66-like element accessory protein TnpA [Caulobacterales bacterium]
MQIIRGEPRRRWSREEKLAAVAAALQPGVRLTDVARAIGANPSMVWAWRKALRGEIQGSAAAAMTFAPVVMMEEPPRPAPLACDDAIRVEFGVGMSMHVPAAAPDALAAAIAAALAHAVIKR